MAWNFRSWRVGAPPYNAGRTSIKFWFRMSAPRSTSYADIPFEAFVEQSIVGVYVLQDERFQYVNATFAGMIGYTAEEMTGMSLQQIIPPDFLPQVLDTYYRRLRGELSSLRWISRGLHKDGRVIMIEVHGSRMEYRGRPAVAGVGIDATERLRREEELQNSRAQLQELATYLNTVREEQRARFARELHDVLGGMLTSIKMDVTRILRRVQGEELVGITRGLLDLTQETIDTVRTMSEELRPSGLDHLGLVATVEREMQRFAARYSVDCSFHTDEPKVELSSERATGVYRIFQEAMTNIARHANARSIQVRLRCPAAEVELEITDDGRGFDPATQRSGALGVLGMKERARELGGRLEVGPRADGGTRLHLVVPRP